MNQNISIWRIRKGVPGVGRKLSKYFDCNEVTTKKPAIPFQEGSYVLNYGRSVIPEWDGQVGQKNLKVINKPSSVAKSVDKRSALKILKDAGVPVLTSTTSKALATSWVEDGNKVVARTKVKSKQGKGIVLIKSMEDWVDAPLYTLHYAKTHEFRVHVLGGRVIDYVQKKRMGKAKLEGLGLEKADPLIRNHKRGWVFARNNIFDVQAIRDLGVSAAKAVDLDLCAVDILAKFSEDGQFVNAVVCETNSAPGMSDSNTFNAYTNALEELMATGGVSFNDAPEVPPVDAEAPEAIQQVNGIVQQPAVDSAEYIKAELGGWTKVFKSVFWDKHDGRLAYIGVNVVEMHTPDQADHPLQDAPAHVE